MPRRQFVYFVKNIESQSAFVLNNCDFNSDDKHDMAFVNIHLLGRNVHFKKKDLTLPE